MSPFKTMVVDSDNLTRDYLIKRTTATKTYDPFPYQRWAVGDRGIELKTLVPGHDRDRTSQGCEDKRCV